MAKAERFDEHEPAERLPRFTVGEYLVQVDKVIYTDPESDEDATGEFLIVEFTILESTGGAALPVGERAKVMEQFDVKWRRYPTERAKLLTYALLGRRGIKGAELLDLWKSDALVGLKTRIKAVPQTDKAGETKTDENGVVYTELRYSKP
jgi:hypothetical protein